MNFSCFTKKLKENVGGLLTGGGGKGYIGPLSNCLGGLVPPGHPLPTPMNLFGMHICNYLKQNFIFTYFFGVSWLVMIFLAPYLWFSRTFQELFKMKVKQYDLI